MAWTVLRESGKYQGCYRDATGDTRSAGTCTQERQALKAAIKAEDEQRAPGAVDPRDGRVEWGVWFEQWFDSHQMAYSTEQCYRSTADCHLMPKWRDVKLCDINHLEVARWVKEMQKPKKKTAKAASVWTVRNSLMLFKTTLNAAVFAKRLDLSPAAHTSYPDLPTAMERYLTPDEVEALAFHMDGLNSLILWTLVQTGMRPSELAGLHWRRLDLERGSIQIVEKFDQKAGVIDPLPKDNEQRSVPLPEDLVMLLRRYREHAAPKRAETCGLPHSAGRCIGDLVFRGPRLAPFRSNEWGKGPFKRALEHSGFEGHARPYDLRHTYASWLLQQGVHLAELARMMGHSDWEVTKKYAHLSEQGYDTVRQALTDHRRIARRIADTSVMALRESVSPIGEQAL
jgi:integrase